MDPRRQSGFALLIVLLILAIVAALTANLAYAISAHSLSVSARTHARQNRYCLEAALEVLRNRWRSGVLSQTMRDEGQAGGQLQIGDAIVQYRIWDEATKFQVNADPQQALPGPLHNRVRRARREAAEGRPLLFEEVFEIPADRLNAFYGGFEGAAAPVDLITLWGDGRINVHTARETVVRARFADLDPVVVESILQLKRYRRVRDVEALVSRLGLPERLQQTARVRLIAEPRTLTIRLACHGPRLRTEGFVVLDVTQQRPRVVLWRDLPAVGPSRLDELAGQRSVATSAPPVRVLGGPEHG